MNCDVFVIGGGPAGYEAALGCARAGHKVIVAEAGDLGGTCLNRGCIPSKLLLGATEVVSELAAQKKQRLVTGEVSVELPAVQKKKTRVVSGTQRAMLTKMKALDVDLQAGKARFTGPTSATVATAEGEVEITFDHAILATGSVPKFPPIMQPDGEVILGSQHALDLAEVPESVLVVGGGYIGLELGQIFMRLGSQVSVVEGLERIAAFEDHEISDELENLLSRKGMKFHTGARVANLENVDGRAKLTLESGEVLEADKALVAVGRGPNVDGLNLDAAGVKTTEQGWVAADEFLRAAPTVSAVGDVNGLLMLAHAAEIQARYVARRLVNELAGKEIKPFNSGVTPSCIYGAPEVLRAGPVAEDLVKQGHEVEVSVAPLAANPMAQAHSAAQGFVKIAWIGERIVSVTAVGHGVSTMGTLAGVMVAEGWTREKVHEIVFPHPSLDEALKMAVCAARGPADLGC